MSPQKARTNATPAPPWTWPMTSRRFLRGEPIHARPTPRWERILKWARRRPTAASLVLFAVLVVVGVAVSGWAWAAREKFHAGQQAQLHDRDQRHLYALQMKGVARAWSNEPDSTLALLEDPIHCPDKLRDFTWGLFYRAARDYRRPLLGHTNIVWAVAFSRDGKSLATASRDSTAILWDVAQCRPIAHLRGHRSDVFAIAVAPNGQLVATSSKDRTVKLWNAPSGKEKGTLRGHGGSVNALAFSPDGLWLSSGSNDGKLFVWDLKAARPVMTTLSNTEQVLSLAFSPDGRMLAAGHANGTITRWDVPSWRKQRPWQATSDWCGRCRSRRTADCWRPATTMARRLVVGGDGRGDSAASGPRGTSRVWRLLPMISPCSWAPPTPRRAMERKEARPARCPRRTTSTWRPFRGKPRSPAQLSRRQPWRSPPTARSLRWPGPPPPLFSSEYLDPFSG